MTDVNITTQSVTVSVDEATNTVTVTTAGIRLETFQALEARVAALEALDIMLLEG